MVMTEPVTTKPAADSQPLTVEHLSHLLSQMPSYTRSQVYATCGDKSQFEIDLAIQFINPPKSPFPERYAGNMNDVVYLLYNRGSFLNGCYGQHPRWDEWREFFCSEALDHARKQVLNGASDLLPHQGWATGSADIINYGSAENKRKLLRYTPAPQKKTIAAFDMSGFVIEDDNGRPKTRNVPIEYPQPPRPERDWIREYFDQCRASRETTPA